MGWDITFLLQFACPWSHVVDTMIVTLVIPCVLSSSLWKKFWHVSFEFRYYDDAACVMRKMFLDAKAPHLSSTIPPVLPWKVNEPAQPSEGLTRQGSGIIGAFGQSEELRCVIAIVRQ